MLIFVMIIIHQINYTNEKYRQNRTASIFLQISFSSTQACNTAFWIFRNRKMKAKKTFQDDVTEVKERVGTYSKAI
jgi:hypothetical protein